MEELNTDVTQKSSPRHHPVPEQLPEENAMQQQELFDERMQQLMNPWMIPGVGPMM